MAESIKLKNDTYWDTSGISHNRQILKDILVVQNGDATLNNLTINGTYNTNSKVDTSGQKQYWLYLGDLTFGGQGTFYYFDVCIGRGNNGNPEQNLLYIICFQKGWVGEKYPIGATALCLQNYLNTIKIKIKHLTKSKVSIYIYIPDSYMSLQYEIHGCSDGVWDKKNEKLSNEPETDKEATYYSTIYKTDGTLSVFDVTTLNATTINATTTNTNEIVIGNIPRNTTDTWVPVVRNGKLEYTLRVMPTSVTSSMWNDEQDRLVTLKFMSFWNGRYNDSASNLKYCHQGIIQAFPTTLYDNLSGTNGTITLSDNVQNYSCIEIFYCKINDRGKCQSVKIYSPNGTSAALSLSYYNNGFCQLLDSIVNIHDNIIDFPNNWIGLLNIQNNSIVGMAANSELVIYKVYGYKH